MRSYYARRAFGAPSGAKSNRHGAVIIMVAILLPVIVILTGFAINLAYIELTRTELRIATDSATRAASRILMNTGDEKAAQAIAQEAANRNLVAGEITTLSDGDIEFGTSSRAGIGSRYLFTPGGEHPNAVRLNARRTASSASGAVKTVFPTFGAIDRFELVQTATSSHVELDVALVLDRSGSMAYGDFEDSVALASQGLLPTIAPPGWMFCDAAPAGSRWRDLVQGVQVFTDVLNQTYMDEYVSLVTYNSTAKKDLDLTSDYANIFLAMEKYTNKLCAGATNIHAGISAGVNSLSDPDYARPWASKVVIVLTDGRHNRGPDPRKAAKSAANQGVSVYTITFSKDADKRKMQQIADRGGGQHFHAVDQVALLKAFHDIALSLPTLLTQ